jgi:ATP-dependent Zn protease
MDTTITVRVPGVKQEINGKNIVFAPLSLASLSKVGERLKKFNGGVDDDSVKLVIEVAYLSLKRNYPDVTMEEIAEEIVDVSNMMEVMQCAMDVSGLKRKAQLEQEALGEVKANQ